MRTTNGIPGEDGSGAAGVAPCGCVEHERMTAVSRRRMFELTAAAGLVTATTVHGARVAFAATPSPSTTPSGSPSPGSSSSPRMSPSPSRSAPPSASRAPSFSASSSSSPSSSAAVPASVATVGAEDVLVVISLRGGFDGLSAVVPIGDAHYARLRSRIGLPAAALKKADSLFGLAPGLKALFPYWDAKQLAVVHAVGQEDPTRSHFDAMAAMERAAPNSSLRTGWIDRSIGMFSGAGTMAAAQVGNTTMPASLYGDRAKFAVANLNEIKIGVDENTVPYSAWKKSLATLHRGARPSISKPTSEAVEVVGKLKAVPQSTDAQQAGYPGGGLSNALHDVARLVKANLGLRVATVDFGNWDMHQNIGGADGGWMFNQLTELAGSMAAFAKELGPDLGRVTVVTLSEFGRRVEDNASYGLDHGHGNAVFVLGGGVNGGKVYGRWPGLSPSALDQGDLAATTDYRSVMAEVLTRRCGVSGTGEIFPGHRPTALNMVRARGA